VAVLYSEETQIDNAEAMRTITPTLVPNETEPLAIDFTGTCPRCGDELPALRRWLVVVTPATKANDRQRKRLAAQLAKLGVDLSHGDETFELTCWCNASHRRRPEGKAGCGVSFKVRVTWSP
jgi:hypothetical protein